MCRGEISAGTFGGSLQGFSWFRIVVIFVARSMSTSASTLLNNMLFLLRHSVSEIAITVYISYLRYRSIGNLFRVIILILIDR